MSVRPAYKSFNRRNWKIYAPELNAVQTRMIEQLLLQSVLDEYEAMRDSGWLETNEELQQWVKNRETAILMKIAKL